MGRNKKENKALSNEDGAFFTYKEEKKDLATPTHNNNEANTHKNTLYIYKDKTTCRVCYDGASDIYNEVYIG
jgi:hypothetical protein